MAVSKVSAQDVSELRRSQSSPERQLHKPQIVFSSSCVTVCAGMDGAFSRRLQGCPSTGKTTPPRQDKHNALCSQRCRRSSRVHARSKRSLYDRPIFGACSRAEHQTGQTTKSCEPPHVAMCCFHSVRFFTFLHQCRRCPHLRRMDAPSNPVKNRFQQCKSGNVHMMSEQGGPGKGAKQVRAGSSIKQAAQGPPLRRCRGAISRRQEQT